MTPQENQSLQEFLNQLTQARGITKDPQAEAMISKAIAQQSDAAYLLVQRSMLLEQALNSAKAQIAQLQSDAQSARPGNGSFLDSGNSWGRSATEYPRAQVTGNNFAAAPQGAPPAAAAAPVQKPGFFSGGSFLGNMAATAAGVAGGAFLFQGIENLLGHHGSGFLGGQSQGFLNQSGLNGPPTENVTVNNFYGDDSLAADGTSDLLDTDYDDSILGDDSNII